MRAWSIKAAIAIITGVCFLTINAKEPELDIEPTTSDFSKPKDSRVWLKDFVDFSANVTITTDYVWRGVSQSDLEPAIQPQFMLQTEAGFYGMVWASNAYQPDFNEVPSRIEIDYVGGWRYEWEGVFVDAAIARYTFPGGVNVNYNEGLFKLGYKIISAELGYTDNVFGNSEYGTYLAGVLDIPVPEKYVLNVKNVSVGGHIGHYYFVGPINGPYSYTDYAVFVRKTMKYLDFELLWKDTDHKFEYPPYDRSEIVFSLVVHTAV